MVRIYRGTQVISASVFVLYVFSYCRVLYASHLSSGPAFYFRGFNKIGIVHSVLV